MANDSSSTDFFGEVFARYFRPSVETYPHVGRSLVHRLLTSTDDVADHVAEARHAAVVWSQAESGVSGMTSEGFLITQCGLMYAADFSAAGHPAHRLHYLATPDGLFDAFVDQVEGCALGTDEIVAVDRRCSHDLAAAHPMDAALRRILDEYENLRVPLSA